MILKNKTKIPIHRRKYTWIYVGRIQPHKGPINCLSRGYIYPIIRFSMCLFSYSIFYSLHTVYVAWTKLSLFCRRYLKFIFVKENLRVLFQFSMKFVPKNRQWLGAEPATSRRLDLWFSNSPMHMCVTKPQWVNSVHWHSCRLSHKPLIFARFTMYLVTT